MDLSLITDQCNNPYPYNQAAQSTEHFMAPHVPPHQSDSGLPYHAYPPYWTATPNPNPNPNPSTTPNTVANPNPSPNNPDSSVNPNPYANTNPYPSYQPYPHYPHDPYAGYGAAEAPPGVTISDTTDQASMVAWNSSSQNYVPPNYNNIPQWPSQTSWENCLPPGVSPNSTPNLNLNLNTNPNPINPHVVGAQPNPPFGHDSWTYGSEYMRPFGPVENSWATTWSPWPAPVPPKVWPKKKNKNLVKRSSLSVKPIVMKEVKKEESPGWCAICQRDCVTEAALKQHLGGKAHKKKVTLQQKQILEKTAEVASSSSTGMKQSTETAGCTSTQPNGNVVMPDLTLATLPEQTVETAPSTMNASSEDGKGVANMLEELWIKMGKKAGKSKEKAVVAVPPPSTNVTPTTYHCYVCNVQCNSAAILEMHFSGKKHASRLKLLRR